MSSIWDECEAKIVVEQPEIEAELRSRAPRSTPRSDAMGVRANGTGEQPALPRDPEQLRARSRGTRELTPDPAPTPAPPRASRELDRDPAQVLRMWPHSGTHAHAHPALDRYRELAEVHAAATVERAGSGTCDNQGCAARTDALRVALASACALVQRAALVTPDAIRADRVEDLLRELLELVER
jgi:hypothetical protein